MAKPRFEVSTEGMRDLQSGREPWQLAKELVSNSWDEATTYCKVSLVSLSPRRARLIVLDDGPGFANISDAWTLMGHTDKRANPTVRGRFNIGEKEILSVAISAKVRTSGKVITFPQSGGRRITNLKTPIKGTGVECIVPWGPRQVENTVVWLRKLMPPKGILYQVNGETVDHKEYDHILAVSLPTVIQEGGIGQPMRIARRATTMELVKLYSGERGWLFEMGIPIQSIDCPYLVDVMQKVPLPPNRDVVKDSYLQDIYMTIVSNLAGDVEEPSKTWVRLGVEDKEVAPEAIKTIMDKRFGDKVILWSSDQRANERAAQAGYEIIHGRTLSPEEREQMAGVGLQHTSDVFPTNWGTAEDFPESAWTEGMRRVVAYAKSLGAELIGRTVTVSMFKMPQSAVAADFDKNSHLRFNVSSLGKNWFESIGKHTTSLLLHEFAHVTGNGHDWLYTANLEKLAGKAVHLALEKPQVFSVKGELR